MAKQFFSRNKDMGADVIQIGVGGYISSGKTMLIDAMFSLFGNVNRPEFMPEEAPGDMLGHAKVLLQYYKSQANLRSFIAVNIGNDKKTKDSGKWDENTFCTKLKFCGKEKVLLVRNLPGEIFEIFYAQDFDGHSIQELYTRFLFKHEAYEKIQKDLFKTPMPDKLEEIQQAFIYNYLDTELGRTIDEPTKKNLANYFYGFLFYLTSDYNIYCIKSTISGGKEAAAHLSNFQYFGPDVRRFFICYTQIDTIMKPRQSGEPVRLPSFDDLSEEELVGKEDVKFTPKHMVDKVKRWLVNSDGQKRNKSEVPIMRYWQAMELLYEDFQQRGRGLKHRYFDEAKMEALRNVLNNHTYTSYLTSVAYHYRSDTFRSFAQTGYVPSGGGVSVLPAALQLPTPSSSGSDEEWNTLNLSMRTPIGVLEMMLNIFSQNGMDLDKSNLQVSKIQAEGFKSVITKIEDK